MPSRARSFRCRWGPGWCRAFVWDGEADQIDPKKLREIVQVFDCPLVNEPMRRFIDWVAAYTLSPPGLVAQDGAAGASERLIRSDDRCA